MERIPALAVSNASNAKMMTIRVMPALILINFKIILPNTRRYALYDKIDP